MGRWWLLQVFGWVSLASAENSWTNHFAVRVLGGENVARSMAEKYGFKFITKLFPGDNFYHFQHPEVPVREKERADRHLQQISNDDRTSWIQQQLLRHRHKRSGNTPCADETQCSIVPSSNQVFDRVMAGNHLSFNDPYYPQQWYLQSHRPQSHGLNVVAAWELGWTGRGVTISVLDDGLMHTNSDISPNYDASVSCNLSNLDKRGVDPTPNMTSSDNSHGTYCAAIMVAAGNNSYCGVGVAYEARIGGVRLLEKSVTDMQEAAALVYGLHKVDIFSSSWGPKDSGEKVDGPGKLAEAALQTGVKQGRNGKGAIYVWAVGNGGLRYDNCNLDGYASSIYTVSINALTESGFSCFYDEPCASTLASTYVGGYHFKPGEINKSQEKKSYVVVPELDGQCRDSFQGTSAAAPLAAGAIALMLQANPELSWRDVQHIVVRTARKPNSDAGWQTNAAGLHYHLMYGFGALDALRLVTTAAKWRSVPQQVRLDRTANIVPLSIPGQDSYAIDIFVHVQHDYGMEHAVACLTLEHSQRGQLELFLMSPAGTVSQLLTQRKLDNSTSGFTAWNFMSVHFWGERPQGTWQLLISNHSKESAIVKYFKLMLYVYRVDNKDVT